MRRVLAAALTLTALLASGCSGVDAEKAQALLDQSTQAMANVKSVSFAMRMWTSGGPEGTDVVVLMHGGGYNKGKHKGDSIVTITGLPGVGDLSVATRGGHAYVRAGGRWTSMPMPAGAGSSSALAGFDLAAYVTQVRVEEGVMVEGQLMSRITGTIDTAAALKGMFASLGAVSGGALPDVFDSFDDTRAVLYVSETTHLPMRTLVDMPVKLAGEKITLHMDIVITAVDEPVALPSPG
ncbi:MAG: hypothetical protein ABI649_07365 [Gaiellaceae bacterium]